MCSYGLISAVFVACITITIAHPPGCLTPSGERGKCMLINECNELLRLINHSIITPENLELLQNSSCGYEKIAPKVCCPEPCYTPDNDPGKCVEIGACPHIEKLLAPPVSKENLDYVEKSKCFAKNNKVCCGPPKNTRPTKVQSPRVNCKNTVSAFPPDPNSRCCGRDASSSDKITGGNATEIDEYPWLIFIEYIAVGTTDKIIVPTQCGGSLISGRYALTAAHCVLGKVLKIGTPKNVRLGEYDLLNEGPDCVSTSGYGTDCTEGAISIPIETIIPHPDYDISNPAKNHDITLLRLKEQAPYTEFIRPICLPSADYTLAPPVKFTLFVSGWGKVSDTELFSRIKLDVDVPFVPENVCQPIFSVPGRNIPLSKGQLCAGGDNGKDSCNGDSGGPLMYKNGKAFEIIGVVSFGVKNCGKVDVPAIYTNVYNYMPWIMSNIKE